MFYSGVKNYFPTLFPEPPFDPVLVGRSPLALWLRVKDAAVLVETVWAALELGHSVSTLEEPKRRLHFDARTATAGLGTTEVAGAVVEGVPSSFSATALNFVEDIT